MSEATAPPALVMPLDKGVGYVEEPLAAGAAAERGWNLLREEVGLPAAVLSEERLAHNLRWMQRFVGEYGVHLAPHGKTTMAPALFRRQLAAGAWGITVATAQQARVAHDHGAPRVLMANQLVGRGNFEIVSSLLRDPGFEFFCLVDSAANVDRLGRFFAGRGQCLPVLLELGVAGGRTGARDDDQVAAVVEAIARWPGSLRLAGVEVYEGVLSEEAEIREFLRRAVATFRELARADRFGRGPAILSGAGSAWYDVVAEEFARVTDAGPVEVVLRPGCYLTHDVGIYRAAQEAVRGRNPIARSMGAGLLPALQLWAYVQSCPEPGRAIVALGKRDAAFDAGFPEPARHYRPGDDAPKPAPAHWKVSRMMDQHAYLDVSPGDDLRVGDVLVFDVSHPCLTFDRWRQLLVVDDGYTVTEVVQTFF
ncbi:MAG TPA: amino acid deaminase [Longimicrobiaceae bacterium]|nr:amino acid deaminase [Longimicrobiaceae bacterium]